MCGIVGYIGILNAIQILIDGLKTLEYRGYDSAGISFIKENSDAIETIKTKGRVSEVEKLITNDLFSNIGIGHTRWATHGEPSYINAHPQISYKRNFSVVHNGIIENFLEIENFLSKKNITFKSETDTEAIAHLLEYYYDGNIFDTIQRTFNDLKGTYAVAIMSSFDKNSIITLKKDNPLIVAMDKNGSYLSSDASAIKKTKNLYYLDNDDMAILTKDNLKFYNKEREITKKSFTLGLNNICIEKDSFPHFMLKEIFEQPKVIEKNLKNIISKENKIIFENLKIDKNIKNIKKIHIVGCGSAYYAGIVGKYFIETINKIIVDCESASEFRYRNPVIDKNTLAIFLTQSGETLDTLAAAKYAKKMGAMEIAITNSFNSTATREIENFIYMKSGAEIAVASTKAYSGMIITLYLLSLYIKKTLESNENKNDLNMVSSLLEDIKTIPKNISKILEKKEEIKKIAKEVSKEKNIFFIGRGIDYAVCNEGSLKLKEISYIHSESYAAGELKHGTIALIEKDSLVIVICTNPDLLGKIISNIKEVKARGAKIITFASEGFTELNKLSEYIFYIPKINPLISASLSVIPLQLLSYYVANLKGLDVDKPRNLAKSVTVE